jgi:soluble lytic murein transglycosylase-like protein
MRARLGVVLSAVVLAMLLAVMPSLAEEKIQAVVTSSGRIVFTNLVDNASPPPPPVITESTDVLAQDMPPVLRSMIDVISQNHGVDPALVRAVIKTESNFNRWAVSNKGARGLMQLIPETGARYGVRDFFDPQQNVEGGVQYLKFLLQKFNGNLDLSLAAYNAGENLVQRLGRIPPIPETTNYVRKVRANYGKKTAPVAPVITRSAPKPVLAAASEKPADQQPVKQAKQETPTVFRTVDERGVVHFSNIGPP